VLAVAPERWLVVSDVPLARYGDVAIERGLRDLDWVASVAMAHEAVIERFRSAEAVVPMKLFTIFTSDERAVSTLGRTRRRLDALLDRVAGRDEWGLRLVVDTRAAAPRAATPRALRPASGTTFLQAKKAERDAASATRRDATRVAAEIYRDVAGEADAARRRALSSAEAATWALDAAFLVRRSRARAFRAAVARAGRRYAGDGYRLTLTGPWPPYTFVGAVS
jgi:hypothetical protein